MYIKSKVDKLIKKYNTRNPFDLCDYLGINVLSEYLGNEVRGIYQYKNRIKIIHINELLEKGIRRQVCCHELGHALLHSTFNCMFLGSSTFFSKSRIEIEANMFAAELLIADEDIKQYFGTGYSLDHIAKDLEVHESLVEYKIKNMSKT